MKNILVPTDFSEQSDYALEVAQKFGQRVGSKIILMHVVENSSSKTFKVNGDTTYTNREEKAFTEKMIERANTKIGERIDESYSMGYDTRIMVGNPYQAIKSTIIDEKIDLVVMGTSGASGFDEMLLGSTTEKVVRYAKCPVLTVHEKQSKFDYKDIVFATSLNNEERECLDIVKFMQEIHDATIHMVRINTPNNFERDVDSMYAMKDFAENAGIRKFTSNIFNDISEEDGIVYFANHIKADLIIMPTHGRTGLAHLLSGSIAEDVVSHSNTPVLTQVIKKNN